MKLLSVVIWLLISAGFTFSQQNKDEKNVNKKIVEVKTLERKVTEPVNGICPVEGKEIDSEITQLIYNNKIIGFCCEGCDEVFLRNPEAYKDKLIQKEG